MTIKCHADWILHQIAKSSYEISYNLQLIYTIKYLFAKLITHNAN